MVSTKLRDSIADIPDSVRRSIRQGFQTLSSVGLSERQRLIEEFVKAMSMGGASVNIAALSKEVGVSSEVVRPFLSALSFLVGTLSSNEFSVEEVIAESKDVLFAPGLES